MPAIFILTGSCSRKSWSSCFVYLRIALSGSTKPDSAYSLEFQPPPV